MASALCVVECLQCLVVKNFLWNFIILNFWSQFFQVVVIAVATTLHWTVRLAVGEAAAVAQSLPKVVGNEVKTAGHPTILHLVRISIEDRADITETTTAHREVQPRTWVETCRVNSVSILFLLFWPQAPCWILKVLGKPWGYKTFGFGSFEEICKLLIYKKVCL